MLASCTNRCMLHVSLLFRLIRCSSACRTRWWSCDTKDCRMCIFMPSHCDGLLATAYSCMARKRVPRAVCSKNSSRLLTGSKGKFFYPLPQRGNILPIAWRHRVPVAPLFSEDEKFHTNSTCIYTQAATPAC